MKKIIIALTIISSIFIFSCEKEKEIRTTPELQQVFNAAEIKDINTIVSFYEERLKKQTNTNQIDSAFHKFAKQNVNELSYDISGFDKEHLQQLYSDLDNETYDEIWDEYKGSNNQINNSFDILNIAYEKKFMTYLDIIGQKTPKIKYVHDRIKSLGMVQGILIRTLYQDFDNEGNNARLSTKIGDFNNRFIVAVFTITIAENILREEMMEKRKSTMKESESEN